LFTARIAGEADIAAIDADRIIVAGGGEFDVGMRGAISVIPAQVEQGGVEIAAIEGAQ
jgi:hypothetical protein